MAVELLSLVFRAMHARSATSDAIIHPLYIFEECLGTLKDVLSGVMVETLLTALEGKISRVNLDVLRPTEVASTV